MKVLLAGGGTGGHIYPAIAIADTIKEYDKYAEIAFIATKKGMEKRLVEKAGYSTYHIEMSGLQRSLSPRNKKTIYCYLTAPAKAKKLIKSFKPDIVIGTGGYLCWPLLHAAAKLGVPSIVHESNAIPGKAVKMIEKEVDEILVNFDSVKDYLRCPEKVTEVGNPLVSDISSETKESAREKLGIDKKYGKIFLSFGGSLGSKAINNAAMTVMKEFAASHPDVLFVHSTGNGYYEGFIDEFKSAGLDRYDNLRPMKYIYDMPLWEAASDAVMCRSGAMTLSEMALYAKPCILIPSPNVVNDHQSKNALRLARENAAVVIEEKSLSQGSIRESVNKVLFSAESAKLADNIKKFAAPDAKQKILKEIIKLVNRDILSLVNEKDV